MSRRRRIIELLRHRLDAESSRVYAYSVCPRPKPPLNSMGADPGPAAPALSAVPLAAPGALLYADLSASILSPPNPPDDGWALGRDLASGRVCRLRVAGTISGGKWR